jgi:hypothetical protein
LTSLVCRLACQMYATDPGNRAQASGRPAVRLFIDIQDWWQSLFARAQLNRNAAKGRPFAEHESAGFLEAIFSKKPRAMPGLQFAIRELSIGQRRARPSRSGS